MKLVIAFVGLYAMCSAAQAQCITIGSETGCPVDRRIIIPMPLPNPDVGTPVDPGGPLIPKIPPPVAATPRAGATPAPHSLCIQLDGLEECP